MSRKQTALHMLLYNLTFYMQVLELAYPCVSGSCFCSWETFYWLHTHAIHQIISIYGLDRPLSWWEIVNCSLVNLVRPGK